VPLRDNRVYAFLCVNTSGPNDPEYTAWGLPELCQRFAQFHAPIPQILAAARPGELILNDISDIAPVTRYAFGRIALLGDAAHATTPNMGQGACQAIEDAAVVARLLTGGQPVEDALRVYERQRIGKATRVVNTSWRIGQVAQWENPLLVALRNIAVSLTSEKSTLRSMAFLFE
jgi:2-polyprenyl-6-methoxyphenol hydroxylase-like FAD-dependent oxidoreductase